MPRFGKLLLERGRKWEASPARIQTIEKTKNRIKIKIKSKKKKQFSNIILFSGKLAENAFRCGKQNHTTATIATVVARVSRTAVRSSN